MLQSLLALLGRILMAALFLWAAFRNSIHFEDTMPFVASKHLPYAPLFLAGAIFLQLVGGAMLLLGYRTGLAVSLLILFLISASAIFHDFWNLQGSESLKEQISFMHNMAIIGGLLAFAAFGPGKWALDK